MRGRPLSVTAVAIVFLAAGLGGILAHSSELRARPFESDSAWAIGVQLIAVLCGVFLLRGKNWARWLAMAWMLFHIVLSVFHGAGEFAVHTVLGVTIGYLLFRSAASRFFRRDSGR